MTTMTSDYPVQLEIDPAASQNRLTVFFRWILAIPHWIVLAFLGIAAFVVWLLASVAIVVTGRYPERYCCDSRLASPIGQYACPPMAERSASKPGAAPGSTSLPAAF